MNISKITSQKQPHRHPTLESTEDLNPSPFEKRKPLFLVGCECKGTTSFSNHQMFDEVYSLARLLTPSVRAITLKDSLESIVKAIDRTTSLSDQICSSANLIIKNLRKLSKEPEQKTSLLSAPFLSYQPQRCIGLLQASFSTKLSSQSKAPFFEVANAKVQQVF